MHMEARSASGAAAQEPLALFLRQVLSLGPGSGAELDLELRSVSPGDLRPALPLHRDPKHAPPCLAFSCGFWKLGSGLHAYVVSSSLTKLAASPTSRFETWRNPFHDSVSFLPQSHSPDLHRYTWLL